MVVLYECKIVDFVGGRFVLLKNYFKKIETLTINLDKHFYDSPWEPNQTYYFGAVDYKYTSIWYVDISKVTTYIAIHMKIIIPSLNSNYPSMCRRSLQFNPTSDSSIVEIYSKKHMRTSLGVVRCFLQCHVTTC